MILSRKKKLSQKVLRQIFWRSFAIQGAFNYERMQNLGFTYSMIPAIKALYDNHDDRVKSLKRHMELFNTTPVSAPAILGVSVSMEEQNANDPTFDPESINSVKSSLMGPLASIGDTLFWGTFRVISMGVGIALALQGSILGPIMFLLLYNVPNFMIRFIGLKQSYKLGIHFLDKIQKNGIVDKIISSSTMVALLVVGGIVAKIVRIDTPLIINANNSRFVLQESLDKLMPNMLTLVIILFVFWMIRRGFSVNKLTIWLILVGIILYMIGAISFNVNIG